MSVLDCSIRKDSWAHGISVRNGVSAAVVKPAEHPGPPGGPWTAVVEKIVTFQQLGNDWDGYGAEAPSGAVVESAVGLAYCFQENGVRPPQRVVPSPGGEIVFEWQEPDGTYTEVEIDAPLHAEVMVIEPGKPAKQWSLPTE